jgi:putative Mg2+ transporter-C (MgtC) family protein
MVSQTEIEILLNLVLALILGGVVGFEREHSRRPAGLRTNILVCMGSAMFGMIATYGFQSPDAAARVVANIIVGVGFLGSGAILKEEETVHGLTTAASLWVVAGIGAAIALRMYFLAITSDALVLLTLYGLHRFERHN